MPKREKARILAAMQQSNRKLAPENFAAPAAAFADYTAEFAGISGSDYADFNATEFPAEFPADFPADDPQRLLAAVVRAHMDTCEFTRDKVQQMRHKARQAPSYSPPTMVSCLEIKIKIGIGFFLVNIAKLLGNLMEMMSNLRNLGEFWRNLKIFIKKVEDLKIKIEIEMFFLVNIAKLIGIWLIIRELNEF